MRGGRQRCAGVLPGSTLLTATFWGLLRRGGSGEGQLGVTAALGQLLGAAGPEEPLQTSVPGWWHLALCPLWGGGWPSWPKHSKISKWWGLTLETGPVGDPRNSADAYTQCVRSAELK